MTIDLLRYVRVVAFVRIERRKIDRRELGRVVVILLAWRRFLFRSAGLVVLRRLACRDRRERHGRNAVLALLEHRNV